MRIRGLRGVLYGGPTIVSAAVAMACGLADRAAGPPVGSSGRASSFVGETTPAEWLKAQPKPRFARGHTLPSLTRFGWTLDFETRVELAENWGYCLEWGPYADTGAVERAMTDPSDPAAKCMALAAKDPKRYKLAVICSRELPSGESVPVSTWTRDADGKILSGQARSLDGTTWTPGMDSVYSPDSPDSVWHEAGRLRADPLRRIRAKCPISVILNGGEYGLGVIGFAKASWEKDPAILRAKGSRSWFEYISERKAHEELIIANAVRRAVPDRALYIYYTTTGGTNRNRWGGWVDWGFGYEWMKPVSDLASSESYYKHFNSGWTWTDSNGDALTQVLNARGFEIARGVPLSYNWVCGGWPRDEAGKDLSSCSDIGLYTGFLKCFYMAGMVGGNAGYYAFPPGGFSARFPAEQPPHWLRQMVALSQVHALFTRLEVYLRKGSLLPGPGKHVWSKDQPAYEFPTNDPGTRVVARKLKNQPRWLVTAWAADGVDRQVSVSIPALGAVSLHARGSGSVYRVHLAKGKPVLVDVDERR